MVHAVTTCKSYHSGTHKFIKSGVDAAQLTLTIVTTQSHAHLLSISPDVLKVNVAQDINLDVLKVKEAQELKACHDGFLKHMQIIHPYIAYI